jgi:hypothetical protein
MPSLSPFVSPHAAMSLRANSYSFLLLRDVVITCPHISPGFTAWFSTTAIPLSRNLSSFIKRTSVFHPWIFQFPYELHSQYFNVYGCAWNVEISYGVVIIWTVRRRNIRWKISWSLEGNIVPYSMYYPSTPLSVTSKNKIPQTWLLEFRYRFVRNMFGICIYSVIATAIRPGDWTLCRTQQK